MSLPTFPTISPPMTPDESLSMILASIAMEELGLSHIISAEGEKIQYILGKLEGGPEAPPSFEEILAVNKSVKCVLDSIAQNQIILKGKMECAVDALEGTLGPTGATGPPGAPGPPGPAGSTGTQGPTGATGATGPSGGERGATGPTGEQGPAGEQGLAGVTGVTGPQGPPGQKGATGSSGACCAIVLPGCSGQCWVAGSPLMWSRQDCQGCCRLCLSSDCKKIVLGGCGLYAVSFSIDLTVCDMCEKFVSIGVQVMDNHKWVNRFVCHMPIVYRNAPFTTSASGIFVSTRNSARSTELMLTLLSPDTVKVHQSSIFVTEV